MENHAYLKRMRGEWNVGEYRLVSIAWADTSAIGCSASEQRLSGYTKAAETEPQTIMQGSSMISCPKLRVTLLPFRRTDNLQLGRPRESLKVPKARQGTASKQASERRKADG